MTLDLKALCQTPSVATKSLRCSCRHGVGVTRPDQGPRIIKSLLNRNCLKGLGCRAVRVQGVLF